MAINAHPPEKVKRAVSAGGECGNVYFLHHCVIRALENEQDNRAKVNGLFGSLNNWNG
jgi:hypothetical protein